MEGGLEIADQIFTDGMNKVILWLLALSSLFMVAEMVGVLPPRLSRWINRNRLQETMRLLREFGVDVETPRRANSVARLENVPGTTLAERVRVRLRSATIEQPVTVGSRVSARSEGYIDLMGATSDFRAAEMYARDLSALWRMLAGVGGTLGKTEIDFVVTPKTGSPLLGAAYARLVQKPLLLHNPEAKFRSDPEDPRSYFDCFELPAAGARALIVDDSSTGGGKAASLITDLRKFGWEVNDFIVVFEPQTKTGTGQNAAERLRPLGVTLHSIVKT